MPDRYKDEAGRFAEIFQAERKDDTDNLPWYYRWFRSDGDKYLCFGLASIAPVLIAWIVQWDGAEQIPQWGYTLYGAVLFVAQACIAFHVALGRWMIGKEGSKFEAALEDVVLEIERAKMGSKLPGDDT